MTRLSEEQYQVLLAGQGKPAEPDKKTPKKNLGVVEKKRPEPDPGVWYMCQRCGHCTVKNFTTRICLRKRCPSNI